jgi:uncharacterized protein (TIGR00369 family)
MRADQYEPLPPEQQKRWDSFDEGSKDLYPGLLGFYIVEVKLDYARLRMPIRSVLRQAGGVVHGGAIASLLDSAVVPAIGSRLAPDAKFSTVDQHIQYIGPLVDEDAIAEGWVVRRGRRTAFCESEIRAEGTGRLVARSLLTYNVVPSE